MFFISKRSDTGQWEGSPVLIDSGKAHVTVSHFSGGWFGWADQVGDWFMDQVGQLLRLSFRQPDCVGQSAVVRGREYSVAADAEGVHACVSRERDSVVTTIHSDSPFVWRFRPTAGDGVGRQGVPTLDLAGMATMLLFDFEAGYSYAGETLLVPGGSASILLKPDVTQTRTQATMDARLGLVAVLIAGLDMAAAMATGNDPETWLEPLLASVEGKNKVRQAVECMAGVVEASIVVDEGRLGQYGHAVLSCTGTLLAELTTGAVSGVVGVVAGIVTSLSGLLVTQVWGALRAAFGQDSVNMHVTSGSSSLGTDLPEGAGWLHDLPKASHQASGDHASITINQDGVPLLYPNSTNQWVGCDGVIARTTFKLARSYSILSYAFALRDHTPAGMQVTLEFSNDMGNILGTRTVIAGEVLMREAIDVSGASEITISARTADLCTSSTTPYGILLDAWIG